MGMSTEPTLTASPDGYREWRVRGRLHRTDGPAVERADGSREWRVNGRLHRTDGPAFEDGCYREWWIKGKELDFCQWLTAVAHTEAERVALIMRWA
jgi:hypothetical protein